MGEEGGGFDKPLTRDPLPVPLAHGFRYRPPLDGLKESHLLVELGVGERQLDGLLDLLDLRLETANVRVRLERRFVNLTNEPSGVSTV